MHDHSLISIKKNFLYFCYSLVLANKKFTHNCYYYRILDEDSLVCEVPSSETSGTARIYVFTNAELKHLTKEKLDRYSEVVLHFKYVLFYCL